MRTILAAVFRIALFLININTCITKYGIVVLVIFSCLWWSRFAFSVAPVFFILQVKTRLILFVERRVLIECKSFPILGM